MTEKEKTVEIRTTLKGDIAQQFKDIKKALGLRHKTETVRAIIREAYKNRESLKQ